MGGDAWRRVRGESCGREGRRDRRRFVAWEEERAHAGRTVCITFPLMVYMATLRGQASGVAEARRPQRACHLLAHA